MVCPLYSLSFVSTDRPYSTLVHRGGYSPNDTLGHQEAQNIQNRLWEGVPSQQKDYITLYILILENFQTWAIIHISFNQSINSCNRVTGRYEGMRCWWGCWYWGGIGVGGAVVVLVFMIDLCDSANKTSNNS